MTRMEDPMEYATRRLERLRKIMTGAVIILVIAILLLLYSDFGPS